METNIFRNNGFLSRKGQPVLTPNPSPEGEGSAVSLPLALGRGGRGVRTKIVQTQYIASLMVAAAMVFAGCSKDDPAPTLTIDKTAISAAHTAGTYSVAVTSNTAWTVAVTPAEATWCNAAPAAGEGDGTVTVNVTENPVLPRAATVTVTAGTLNGQVVVAQESAAPTTLCAQCCWDGAEWVDCYVTTNAYPFNSSSDNTSLEWSGNGTTYYSGARSDRDGRANTAAISSTGNSAVQICKNLGTGWYLPAYEELYAMSAGAANAASNNRAGANLLATPDVYYWSSTELYNNGGRIGSSTYQYFAVLVSPNGNMTGDYKTSNFYLRCAWRD